MKSSTLYLASLLAATAKAQSAPQFEVVVSENLPVTYVASGVEITPGLLVPRNDTLQEPSVGLPSSAPENQTYIVFCVDQDVVRNGSTFNLLHWFRPGLTRSMDNSSLVVTMIDDGTPTIEGAAYIPPTPPGGTGPHRYTFLLYEQPEDFAVPQEFAAISPPANTSARIGFSLTAFASAAGLGNAVAANYLRVLNGTEAETSSAQTQTGTLGVAPTESPTAIASTTGTGTSATGTGSATSSGSTTGESSPAETASNGAALDSGRDLMLGFALAVLGAGMFIA